MLEIKAAKMNPPILISRHGKSPAVPSGSQEQEKLVFEGGEVGLTHSIDGALENWVTDVSLLLLLEFLTPESLQSLPS